MGHVAAAVGETPYVIGGMGLSLPIPNTLYAYDYERRTWIEKNPPPWNPTGPAAAAIGNKIYVCTSSGAKGVLWEYDSLRDSWSTKTPIPTARIGPAATVHNGMLYVIGGYRQSDSAVLAVVEAYDPVNDTWIAKAPMLTPRRSLGAAVVNGKIYAAGGMGYLSPFQVHAEVEEYDPAADKWTAKTPMNVPRAYMALVAAGGRLYAIGGFGDFTNRSTVEEYDPISDRWLDNDNSRTSIPRMNFAATVVGGAVLAIGGETASGGPTALVESALLPLKGWMEIRGNIVRTREGDIAEIRILGNDRDGEIRLLLYSRAGIPIGRIGPEYVALNFDGATRVRFDGTVDGRALESGMYWVVCDGAVQDKKRIVIINE